MANLHIDNSVSRQPSPAVVAKIGRAGPNQIVAQRAGAGSDSHAGAIVRSNMAIENFPTLEI